jgi:hypothetical protein
LVEICELSQGILAGPRAANAGGNLFPISHVLTGIVSADDRNGQETPRPSESRDFVPGHLVYGF